MSSSTVSADSILSAFEAVPQEHWAVLILEACMAIEGSAQGMQMARELLNPELFRDVPVGTSCFRHVREAVGDPDCPELPLAAIQGVVKGLLQVSMPKARWLLLCVAAMKLEPEPAKLLRIFGGDRDE